MHINIPLYNVYMYIKFIAQKIMCRSQSFIALIRRHSKANNYLAVDFITRIQHNIKYYKNLIFQFSLSRHMKH